MRGLGRESHLLLAMVASLLGVLIVLAVLQNRWITQLSDAERQRLKTSLDAASARLCDNLDRELSPAFKAFRLEERTSEGELAEQLTSRLARWRSTAPAPQLVKELLVVDPRPEK